MVKQRQESVAIYEQGGRPELAQQEREEIEIIQGYMPKQLSDEEVKVGDRRGDQGGGRHLGQGHGQGDGGAQGEICRADGYRQGRRGGEEPIGCVVLWSVIPATSAGMT